jgi:hypothetical protein
LTEEQKGQNCKVFEGSSFRLLNTKLDRFELTQLSKNAAWFVIQILPSNVA